MDETSIRDGDQCDTAPPSIFTVFLHFPMFPILSPPHFLSVYGAATSSYIDLSSLVCAESALFQYLTIFSFEQNPVLKTKALSRGAQDM